MSIQNFFERAILDLQIREKEIALGLSGGVDSILMAETLQQLKIPFIALHFNHRWREKQSDRDASWVKRWCDKKQINCIIGISKIKGVTSENIARQERYNFFKNTCKKSKINTLLLAHHADDAVETMLFQLLRGSGLDGLEGIKQVSHRESLRILRPWLHIFKEEIVKQAKTTKLMWREDATNKKSTFTRNRLRHEVLPLLSKILGRDVKRNLLRTTQILSAENEYWSNLLPATWPERTSVKAILAMPLPVRRRWVRGWLLHHKVSDVSFDVIEKVMGLIQFIKPSKINLAKNWFCRRTAGELWIQKTS